MNAALAIIATIGTVAVGALGVWVSYQEEPDRRAHRIRRDLEILEALPADTDARIGLRAHVEQSIATMLEERKRSRNLSNVFWGVFTVAYGLFLYGLGTSQGGWWRIAWAPPTPFVVVGLLGAVDGLKRGERDSEGLLTWRWQERRRQARQVAGQTTAVE